MPGAAPFPYSNCSPQRKGRVSHETSRSDKKDSLNSHFPTAATRAAAGAHSDTPTGRAAVQSLLSQQPACTGPRGPRACRERPHGAVLFPHPTDGQRKNTFQPQSRARAGCASLRPLPRRCEAIDMEAAAAAGCERPRTRSGRRARSPPISTSGQVLVERLLLTTWCGRRRPWHRRRTAAAANRPVSLTASRPPASRRSASAPAWSRLPKLVKQ